MFEELAVVQGAMDLMVNTKLKTMKQNYKVRRLVKELEAKYNEFAEMYQEIMKAADFGPSHDAEGKEIPADRRTLNNQEELDIKVQELFEVEFELNETPLSLKIFEQINPPAKFYGVFENFVNMEALEAREDKDEKGLEVVK